MMFATSESRKTARRVFVAVALVSFASAAHAQQQASAGPPTPAPVAAPEKPSNNYWVYVGAESADLIQRLRFGPNGLVIERTIPIGDSAADESRSRPVSLRKKLAGWPRTESAMRSAPRGHPQAWRADKTVRNSP